MTSTMTPNDELAAPVAAWAEQVREAAAHGRRLYVRGGGSLDFYGASPPDDGKPLRELDTRSWSGVEACDPVSGWVRVRAGTPVLTLEAWLAERGLSLPFESPRWQVAATQRGPGTVGGMVATGLGALREHLLACTWIDGVGQCRQAGVPEAGVVDGGAMLDARDWVGSLGTLGVLVDVTLRVRHEPEVRATMRMALPELDALPALQGWLTQGLPIEASAGWDGLLLLRLAGDHATVVDAVQRLHRCHPGEVLQPEVADAFWGGVRDHRDEFFVRARQAVASSSCGAITLWRLAVPLGTPPLGLRGEQLTEALGMVRWVCTAMPAGAIHALMAQVQGQAVPFCKSVKQPWSVSPAALRAGLRWQGLRQALDPHGVFDTDRAGLLAAAQAADVLSAR